ncbi:MULTISPECIES: hypothetical protein [Halomonadaceae]|uniref:hypothetical protein n=1 Tax=Halomonadaceae TaxID=28256 RepID=UPI0015992661|nr:MULTISPECIES: hypothetical protein [Halomonas]QJQ96317.1 hypothetical protein HIO72_14275 [Halomonas sp. PA5]
MMSQAFLKRIGILGISVGLAVSPFAFSQEENTEEEYEPAAGQMESDDADMELDTEAAENGDDAEDYPGAGEEEISADTDEAGAAGIEGAEGTQSGDEPNNQ